MNGKKSFISTLLHLTYAGAGIVGFITAYLVVMALLAMIGSLPKNMDATFELPINIHHTASHYPIEDLSQHFYGTNIEVKKAELEIMPRNRTWPQTLGYLQAATYLAFFMGILISLSKILENFNSDHPFISPNVKYFKWIGLLAICIAVYEFSLNILITNIFADKFIVKNADIVSTPSFWKINFMALFLGAVFLAIAEAFKKGVYLQELEKQTV